MNRKEIRAMKCSVARALSVIGDRWTLLILREAFLGVRRFEAFQQSLSLARNILTFRLQDLMEEGILRKSRYHEKPDRYEYFLTEKGRDLYPVMVALMEWGDRWMAGEAGPPVVLVHKSCEHESRPVLACSHCGKPLAPRDVRVMPGPGLAPAAS